MRWLHSASAFYRTWGSKSERSSGFNSTYSERVGASNNIWFMCFFYYLTICLKTNTKNYYDNYLCKLIFIDADYETVVKLWSLLSYFL